MTNPWLNLNQTLNRQEVANQIRLILSQLDANINNPLFKKGIYIYGSPGCGKTHFVTQLLKDANYDIVHYDAGDNRNKALIESITSDNVSNRNVFYSMKQETKKLAIVMDEIDGINNGDKGSMMALIKVIRQKKTKKQKSEKSTVNPIICIGNMFVDKKIRELMKVCHVFRLKTPTNDQITTMLLPQYGVNAGQSLLKYIQGDLRKLEFILRLYKTHPEFITGFSDSNQQQPQQKYFNDDTRTIAHRLLHNYIPLKQHYTTINETDRTTVGLLWHENIIDILGPGQSPLYLSVLKNICFSDYIDRLTFQNQIWQFNEMSSLIKTFYCNKIVHDSGLPKGPATQSPLPKGPATQSPLPKGPSPTTASIQDPADLRFTKVLTKYSTEYNNNVFISAMCNDLEMDKKDMISYFNNIQCMRAGSSTITKPKKSAAMTTAAYTDIERVIGHPNIGRLDVKRIFQFMNKNLKKESTIIEDDSVLGEELDEDRETE